MMLQRSAKFEFTSVPYRGGAPLLQDLLGGQVPVSFNVLGEVLPSIKTGKLRSLAVTSPKRSTFMPETPTMMEQGFPDIALQEWLGWFLPAKTPNDIVRRLNAQVRESMQAPDMIEGLARNALEPMTQSPEEFILLLKADMAHWGPIVKATGFKAEE
jgi:tripartite-type tricarboxylate transporter receptor subunit TctC